MIKYPYDKTVMDEQMAADILERFVQNEIIPWLDSRGYKIIYPRDSILFSPLLVDVAAGSSHPGPAAAEPRTETTAGGDTVYCSKQTHIKPMSSTTLSSPAINDNTATETHAADRQQVSHDNTLHTHTVSSELPVCLLGPGGEYRRGWSPKQKHVTEGLLRLTDMAKAPGQLLRRIKRRAQACMKRMPQEIAPPCRPRIAPVLAGGRGRICTTQGVTDMENTTYNKQNSTHLVSAHASRDLVATINDGGYIDIVEFAGERIARKLHKACDFSRRANRTPLLSKVLQNGKTGTFITREVMQNDN